MADEFTPAAESTDPVGDVGAEIDPLVEGYEGDPRENSPEGTPAAETTDPYADFGGREAVEQALAFQKSLQTEDGIWNVFFQAGRALGLQTDQISGLFGAATADQGGSQESEPADDDVLTWGQAKALMEQALSPIQQREQQQAENLARQTIDSTLNELGVADPAIRETILLLGDPHLNGDLSPAAVKAAVQKGYEQYVKAVNAERARLVAAKRAQGATVPKSPAGAPPAASSGEAPASEPRSVQEAIQMARAKMRQGR